MNKNIKGLDLLVMINNGVFNEGDVFENENGDKFVVCNDGYTWYLKDCLDDKESTISFFMYGIFRKVDC